MSHKFELELVEETNNEFKVTLIDPNIKTEIITSDTDEVLDLFSSFMMYHTGGEIGLKAV